MSDFQSCDSVWDLLSLYADEEGDAAQRALVERHVADCRECARDLRFLRETATLLTTAPDIAPPSGLREAILAATIHRPTWQERLRSILQALPAPRLQLAGGAAVAVLVGLLLFNRAQAPIIEIRYQPTTTSARTELATKDSSPNSSPIKRSGSTARNLTDSPSGKVIGETVREAGNDQRETRLAWHVESINSPRMRRNAIVTSPTSSRKPVFRLTDDNRLAAIPAPMPSDEGGLNEPADMREVSSPMPNGDSAVKVAKNEENPAGPGENDSSKNGAPTKRYTLTASLPAGGADSMVTFADLRSALRKRSETARAVPVDFGANDRNALWDVYKSRF